MGFDSFQFKPVFDPSLLVDIRKRLGNEAFDKMNQIIVLQAIKFEDNNNSIIEKLENDDILTKSADNEAIERDPDAQKPTNSGKSQMDAIVCDTRIKYIVIY